MLLFNIEDGFVINKDGDVVVEIDFIDKKEEVYRGIMTLSGSCVEALIDIDSRHTEFILTINNEERLIDLSDSDQRYTVNTCASQTQVLRDYLFEIAADCACVFGWTPDVVFKMSVRDLFRWHAQAVRITGSRPHMNLKKEFWRWVNEDSKR